MECRTRRRKRDWDSNVVSNVDADFNTFLQLLAWLLFFFYILLTVFIYYINLYFISYLKYFIDRERISDRESRSERDSRSEREGYWWCNCWEFSESESRAEDPTQCKLIIVDSITMYELTYVLSQILPSRICIVLNLNLCIYPWYFLIRLL